MIFFTF